jgi:hypothetical protein
MLSEPDFLDVFPAYEIKGFFLADLALTLCA